ncbi:MAG: MATE family efflux transporter [Streptosporangiaceae bacterium]
MPRCRPDRELDRCIAALALPALGSIAAEPAYSLADTAIVGHLGRVPLDSLAIATTSLTMTAWVAIFLTTATTSAVAGLAAGRATDRAARSAGAAYLVAAAGGTAVAVAMFVAARLGAAQQARPHRSHRFAAGRAPAVGPDDRARGGAADGDRDRGPARTGRARRPADRHARLVPAARRAGGARAGVRQLVPRRR